MRRTPRSADPLALLVVLSEAPAPVTLRSRANFWRGAGLWRAMLPFVVGRAG